MSTGQFYLAVGPEDYSEIYRTELEALALKDFCEAEFVYLVTPDEMRIRDYSEILATKWWAKWGEAGAIVPAAYQKWLLDEIWAAENRGNEAEDRAEHQRDVRMGR